MNDLPTLMQLSTSPEAAGTGMVQRPAVVPGAAQVAPARGAIEVTWARHLDEVRQAQRLRFEVFAAEMGARLTTPVPGHDVDLFDDYCEHLLVRDAQSLQVIGTYRVLTPAQAKRVGGTYSDTEFDLTRLRTLRPRMVELGRSCVHPDHRHGGVIMALWSALADFMVRNELDTMIGCASIPMLHNGVVSGDAAASIWQQVRKTHLAPIEYHVLPRLPLPVEHLDGSIAVDPPALIKGYLRLGARVLGAPGGVRVGCEAALRFGWDRWLGERGGFVGMRGFGASGGADELYRHFGITAEAIVAEARRLLAGEPQR